MKRNLYLVLLHKCFNTEELDKIEDMLGEEELERSTRQEKRLDDKANTENTSVEVAKTGSSV